MAHGLKVGDRVAVGGLRRPDQTIVASLIEKRAGGPDQIAGLLTEDGGAYRIGGQIVTGAVGGGVAGERVVALGALENGVFVARTVKLDTIVTIGAVRNVSVEAWVSAQDGALVTAGGLRVEGAAAGLPAGARRVVIDGALGANGALIASRIALPNGRGDFSPPGGARGGPGGGNGSGGPAGGGMNSPGGPGSGPQGGLNGGAGRPGGFGGGPAGSAAPGAPPALQPGGGFGGPGGPGGFGGPGGGPLR